MLRERSITFVLLLLTCLNSVQGQLIFEFDPWPQLTISEGSLNCSKITIFSQLQRSEIYNLSVVSITSLDKSVARVYNFTQAQLVDIGVYGLEACVKGVFLGRTAMEVKVKYWTKQQDKLVERDSLPRFTAVAVLKKDANFWIQTIMTVLLASTVLLSVLRNSILVNFAEMKLIFKQPYGPLISLLAQFILMPLVGLGWGRLLLVDQKSLLLGYFTVSCSPGGFQSNMFAALFKANVDLSLTIAMISTVASLGAIPLWLYLVAPLILPTHHNLQIPVSKLFGMLTTMLAVLLVGLILHFKPNIARTFSKVLRLGGIVGLLLMIVYGLYATRYIFHLFTWQLALAALLLPWSGLLVGGGLAILLRQPWPDVKSISIETGMQNSGIAMAALRLTLSPPDSDLATVMPMSLFLFSMLQLLFVFMGIQVWKRMRSRWPAVERINRKMSLAAIKITKRPGYQRLGSSDNHDGSHGSDSEIPQNLPTTPDLCKTESVEKTNNEEHDDRAAHEHFYAHIEKN